MENLKKYQVQLLGTFFGIIKSYTLSMRDVSKLTRISHTKIWLWLKAYESNEEICLKASDGEIIEDFIRRVEEISSILKKILKNWPEDQNAFWSHFLMDVEEVSQNGGERLTGSTKRILRHIAFAPRRNPVRKFFFRL